MLFSPANLPYWIFLGTGGLLFLLMIFMGGGGQDVDIEADLDIETDGDFAFGDFLGWAGIGKAPLLLLLATDLSLWGIIGWIINVTLDSIIAIKNYPLLSGFVLFISLIISLCIGRWIAQSISQIFSEFGEDASSDRLIGCIGTVTSVYIPTENLGKIGQIDVLDAKHNLLTVTAVIPDWATIAPQRGEKVIIVEIKQGIYLVLAKDSPDEQNWLNNSNHRN
jgi:hypothetical protein